MTFVFTNPSQSFSKTGRSAEDIIRQSGDVMKGDFPVTSNINENNLSSPVNMVVTKGKPNINNQPMIRNSEYSSPTIALGGSRLSIPTMSKTGSIGIGGNNGGNILSTPPQFYSPIHTPTNWQIPTKRREVYLWSLPVDFTELTSFDFTHKNVNDLDFVVDNVIEDTLTSGKVYSLSDSSSIISGDGSPSSPIRYYDIDDNEEPYIDVSFIGTHHKVYGHKDHPIYILPHKGKNGYFRSYRRFVENRRYKGLLGGHNFREEAENTKWEIKKKSFSELNKKDWGLIPIGKFENNYTEYSSDFFYTVGLLLADGFKTYNDKEKLHGSGIGITFDTTRPEIIDFIKNFLSEKYPNNTVFERPNPPSEKCISLRIKSVDAFNDFDKFVCGTYAQKKIRIPFTDLSKEQTLNLIAGYFDGDGCYNKVDDLLQMPSISEDISNQIYYACLYTGMSSTINKYTVPESWKKFGKVSSETFTTVTIPSCSLDIIKKYSKTNKIPKEREYKRNIYYLKGGFFLTDKDNQRYFARRIKNIKKFKYTGKSFDLEIPINHSYCVSGFKVSNCRFFSNNNPTIKASLRFYSQFPFSGYDHIISDSIRKEHFDNLKKRLRLEDLMPQIAYEYFAMGDAFPFISISCPKCNGWGTTPEGEPCDHAGGEIGSVTLINPDLIDVKNNPLNPAHSVITLVPDPSLEAIINSQQPKEIYDMIPDHIKRQIASKQPILLDSQRVTHLKHDPIAYQTYGQSVIVPLFPILAYLDRLRQAQWIIAERHILPIKICKVGTEQRPAGPQDLANVQQQLAATANDPNLTLVTHHAFDLSWAGAAGKVLQLTKEYDMVDKDIIKGLGVSEALLSGQGPSYGQAAIGIEATIKRLKTVQNLLAWWVTEKIYKAEAKIKGFYKEDKLGRKVLDYPQIRWDDLNLRDETQKNNMYLQLWDKGIVSTQFICEKLDIDYNNEVEKVRMEQQYQLQLGISPQSKGGAKGGLGGGFSGGTGGGLPGDDLAPSLNGGEGGGGTPSGGAAMESDDIQLKMKNFELAKAIKPMVHRPSKYRMKEPKQPKPVQPEPENELFVGPRNGSFNLTSIERILYSSIIEAQKAGQLPEDFVWQEKPEPNRMSRVVVDGIFPSIRLIVEADGKQFHSAPDDVAKDQERDAELARYGWTVIRFTEEEIENRIKDVIATIIKFVREMSNDENENLAFSKNDLVKIANNIYIEKNNYKAMYTVADVKEQKSEQDQITKFLIYIINHTASDVHNDWRKTRFNKESEEYEPRIKKTEDEKWIEENETDEVDIANTEYKDLPKDWKDEYRISSQIAVWRICEAIKNDIEIDNDFINKVSDELHSAWIDRNPEAEEELKVPYDELSEEDKDKDRLFVEKALDNVSKLKVNINL